MIKGPAALIIVLLAIETSVLFVSSRPRFEGWFKYIPSIFWMYFLPMLASTFGIIDGKSPVFTAISNTLLPMALFLLLVTVDVRAIMRVGSPALFMFFAGAAGIGAGVSVAFWVFKPLIGKEFWSGFGALAGSWTGGSANMIAVKEALGTPDNVFLPMVVVDTIVPYLWMGCLILAARSQERFDRFNHSDRRMLDDISRNIPSAAVADQKGVRFLSSLGIIVLAIAGGLAARSIAQFFPVFKGTISTYAWTIILVSFAGVGLSLTPLKKIGFYGSTKIGYFILYFVLASIGARASMAQAGQSMVLIGAGFVIVIIHALFLLAAARLIRAPLFLVAVASQANVGGVVSAPVVAEIYQKGFGSLGLLLAILGNIVGTYIGIAVGEVCRFLW